jgi:hypothetical protein
MYTQTVLALVLLSHAVAAWAIPIIALQVQPESAS